MRWRSGATRRELLCNTALGTAALAADGIGAYAQPASKPPNIIFILADGPEVGSLRGGCGAVSGSVRMAAQLRGISGPVRGGNARSTAACTSGGWAASASHIRRSWRRKS